MTEVETMESWLSGEPVWTRAKIIETWGSDFEHWHTRMAREIRQAQQDGEIWFRTSDDMRLRLGRGLELWHLRDEWTTKFGFAIPCAELLDALAGHKLVVDVGAGTGYMTRLMLNRGITAIATNPARGDYSFEHGKYAEIVPVEGKTAARMFPHATIFCSWPTLNHTWFRQMLRAMRVGQHLVVIRESACAEDSAWSYLEECFDETDTIELPVFEHMSDYASCHVKKRQKGREDGTAMQP